VDGVHLLTRRLPLPTDPGTTSAPACLHLALHDPTPLTGMNSLTQGDPPAMNEREQKARIMPGMPASILPVHVEGGMRETPYLQDRSDLIEVIRKIPFFSSYTDEQLLEILSLSRIRTFEPGEYITRQGEYDSWLYIVLSGAVNVSSEGTTIAQIRDAGQTIGEMALVDGEPRSASAKAVAKTTTLAIDMSLSERLNESEKERFEAVYYKLLAKILVDRLRKTTHELAQARNNVKELTDAILVEQDRSRR